MSRWRWAMIALDRQRVLATPTASIFAAAA
jgi:hypothetical protein